MLTRPSAQTHPDAMPQRVGKYLATLLESLEPRPEPVLQLAAAPT